MSKKWWIVVAVVVLIAVLGFVGYQRISARRATAETPVETAVVRRGTLLVTVGATGSLAPRDEVSLAFASSGQVAELFVEEGEQVEAGQPLAQLDTGGLALQVTQAQLSLRQAELDLETLQEPADEADVEIARAAVSDAAAAYDEARSNLTLTEHSVSVGDEVRAARYNRDKTYQRYQDLVNRFGEDDSRTEMAHDAYLDALGAYNRAVENSEAQMTTAQNKVTQAYHSLQQAQGNLQDLLDGADESDVEAAQLRIDQARASLEQAQLQLEQATLTAPIAGTITALNIRPGEMASAGQSAVVVISDLSVLEVEVNLDETDVARVAVGQKVQVSLDAFPGVELAGEVTYIAPMAQTQVGVVLYPVTIRLTPADPSTSRRGELVEPSGQALPLRAGMTADVTIAVASKEDALIVPLRAVHTERERAYAYRLVGGQIEQVEVTLGMMTDTEVEITSGLAEGDVVSVVAAPTQDSTGQGFGPRGIFGRGD